MVFIDLIILPSKRSVHKCERCLKAMCLVQFPTRRLLIHLKLKGQFGHRVLLDTELEIYQQKIKVSHIETYNQVNHALHAWERSLNYMRRIQMMTWLATSWNQWMAETNVLVERFCFGHVLDVTHYESSYILWLHEIHSDSWSQFSKLMTF